MPPPKRDAGTVVETVAENKRYRNAIDEMAEEFLCPITQELPIDPVTAEDGRVYERSALKDWLDRRPEGQIKSPVTNEPMGKRLFPAVQVRNTIKSMVRSGAISGAKSDAWKQRIAEEEEVGAKRRAAEGGDARAMIALGGWYLNGKNGLERDSKQAFTWFVKAADLDDPLGISMCGQMLCLGDGVEKDTTRGLIMLGQAAGMGSEFACFLIGDAYAKCKWGVRHNDKEARKWFGKMAGFSTGSCRASQFMRDEAVAWLHEHW